jgi:hypothetical protein
MLGMAHRINAIYRLAERGDIAKVGERNWILTRLCPSWTWRPVNVRNLDRETKRRRAPGTRKHKLGAGR